MKFTGKRQIGELDVSDLVTTLMLSELAVAPIADNNIPLLFAVIPMILLLSFEIIITFITTKSNILKKILVAKPSYIIKNGKLEQKELEKVRINIDELIGELRLKNVCDIKNVDYAILESNGQLSVLPKSQNTTDGMAHAVIIDGCINKKALQIIKHDEHWLDKSIQKQGFSLKDVLLFTVSADGSENWIKKEQ
jgi:uncharacterized membrane protein YcaP (DUF421 family)